jgi:hypothetical protein
MSIYQFIERKRAMNRQQTLPMLRPNLLRRTLLGNAAFSTACAIIFLLWSKPVAVFLGINEPLALLIIGVGVLLGAADVAWTATRPQLDRKTATAILILDVAWVVGSVILLLSGWVAFSAPGKWAVIGVADVVAFFAILEYFGLRQVQTTR